MSEILVREIRGEIEDDLFRGDICVVDGVGRVIASLGNVKKTTFYRSAAKPFQSLPFLMLGLDKKYGFSPDEIAMTGASHLGEPFHVAKVEKMLQKTGFAEEDMVMGASYPTSKAEARKIAAAGLPKRKIYHGCSGKHVALMSIARELGDAPGEYRLIESRVGQASLRCMSVMSGYPMEKIGIAVDGCGVPVHAVPLDLIALSYARFASPELVGDGEIAKALAAMKDAYHACPRAVRGENSLCKAINEDENLVGKLGANGLYCVGMQKEKIGFAIKAEDGLYDHLTPIVASILRQLGYQNEALYEKLDSLFDPIVYNGAREKVGHFETCFTLFR